MRSANCTNFSGLCLAANLIQEGFTTDRPAAWVMS